MFRNPLIQRVIATTVLAAFTNLAFAPLVCAAQAKDALEKAGIVPKPKNDGFIGNAKRYIEKLAGNHSPRVSLSDDERFSLLLAQIHEDLKAAVPHTAMQAEARKFAAGKQGADGSPSRKGDKETRAIGPDIRIETEAVTLKPLPGTDIAARVKSIKGKAAEIKELYAAIDKGFKDTEQHLKNAGLAQEMLERHRTAVFAYEMRKAEFERLMGKIEQAADATAEQAALADLGAFMSRHPHARPHQYTDPNKMPFSANSGKVRAPIESTEQYQSSLFPPRYKKILLAGAIPDGLKLAQATLPETPAAADTAATDDAQITQAIRDKAAELNNDPVRIYNWVRNNVSFIPSYGSIQGSEMTLLNKSGNAFDTASLLIALYRAAGIPARYVYGTIEVPADKAMNWVGGVTRPGAAQNLLGQGGIPNIGVTSGGVVTKLRMEHVWVEAYVDYAPSRGARNKTPRTWVSMDASYKQYRFTRGADVNANVPVDSEALLAQVQQGATVDQAQGYVQNLNQANLHAQLETYQNQAKTHIADALTPDSTVGDVLGMQSIVQEERPILLGSLPYRTLAIGNTFQVLPDNLRWKFKTNIYAADGYSDSDSPIMELNQSTAKFAGKKITLSFVPASQADRDLINSYLPKPHADGTPIQESEFPRTWPGYLLRLKAEFRVDGQVVAQTSESFTHGSMVRQASMYFNPSTRSWEGGEDNDITVGEYNAIGIDLQGTGPQQVQSHLAKLNSVKEKLDQYQQNTSDTAPLFGMTEDDLTGNLVQTGIVGYFAQVDTSDTLAARAANNVVTYRLPSYGRFFTTVQPRYFFGVVRSVNYPGVGMDVDYLRYHTAARNDNPAVGVHFMKQAGAAGSAAEHAMPESLLRNPDLAFNDPAQPQGVSAVKALAIAAAQGQKIYTLNQSNEALHNTILQSLQISQDVKTEIANGLAVGREVTVHERDIGVNGWVGSGYTIVDTQTGSGAYKIAGGGNGADMLTLLLAGASGYLDGLTRFKDHWFNAGNAAKYAKISGILTVFSAIFSVVMIVKDPNLSVTQKIQQIVINIGAAMLVLGISQAIMGTALIAVSNPILLGLLIATIAITISLLAMELVLLTTAKLNSGRTRTEYA